MENTREKYMSSAWEYWEKKVSELGIEINDNVTCLDKPYLLTMRHFRELNEKFLKHPNIKKFHVSKIEKLDSPIVNTVLGANTCTKVKNLKGGAKRKYEVYDWKAETGMFLIEFSEKKGKKVKVIGHAIYTSWLYGDRGEMSDFLITSPEMYTRIIDLTTNENIVKRTPSKGVFTAHFNANAGVNVYKDISSELRGADVIHEQIHYIKKDVKFFFENLKHFTNYNLPGQRKILIAGEPGTGNNAFVFRNIALFFLNIISIFILWHN